MKFVSKEYHAAMKDAGVSRDDEEAKAELFKEQMDWYEERLSSFIDHQKSEGKTGQLLNRAVQPFIQEVRLLRAVCILSITKILVIQSSRLYARYGVHAFGAFICTERGPNGESYSFMWGGSPAYLAMREEYSTVITGQIADYEGMFRCVVSLPPFALNLM